MSLNEFYDYTPVEIDYAFRFYYENEDQKSKIIWEQTRLKIYYSYLFSPSQKRKVTYITFKRDYLPFSFDEKDKEDKEVIDDNTFSAIQDFFKQKIEGPK